MLQQSNYRTTSRTPICKKKYQIESIDISIPKFSDYGKSREKEAAL
jgi:hypothetical protein